MNAKVKVDQTNNGSWLPVFIPGARCLMDQEIGRLPLRMRKAVEEERQEGVWLKVHCPERTCITDDAKLILPAKGVALPKQRSLWLSVFCPEERCLVEDYTDLP